MPPNHFESEVESFLEGSHGDRTHHKQRADHHTVTPLCGTLLYINPDGSWDEKENTHRENETFMFRYRYKNGYWSLTGYTPNEELRKQGIIQ